MRRAIPVGRSWQGMRPRAVPRLLKPYTDVLTPAQMVVFLYLLDGHSAPEIAAKTGRGLNTIQNHASAIRQALGVRTQAQLLAKIGWPMLQQLERLDPLGTVLPTSK